MGGLRDPGNDPRTLLYQEFFRCLKQVDPPFFIVENVAGMQWLNDGQYLQDQVEMFREAGRGYLVSVKLLNAKDYGIPAERRRIFLVGVRRDLSVHYWFPDATHGPPGSELLPYVSHGEAIKNLPLDPKGEYYDIRKPAEWWWYVSRNRKRPWAAPSYTIVANWRHVPLHPASPTMELVSSDLANKSKQVWRFSDKYDHLDGHPERLALPEPRRLSWRECAVLQTFPEDFEPAGSMEGKYRQIGNAVPPLLMQMIVRQITNGDGLRGERPPYCLEDRAASRTAGTAQRRADYSNPPASVA
jgi:DNA (cytosine-5)-methyltransferase 1